METQLTLQSQNLKVTDYFRDISVEGRLIEMALEAKVFNNVDWIHLAQNKKQ
jgi:hypothetical protein